MQYTHCLKLFTLAQTRPYEKRITDETEALRLQATTGTSMSILPDPGKFVDVDADEYHGT